MLKIILSVAILAVLGGVGWCIYLLVRKFKYQTADANTVLLITGGNLKPDKEQDNIVKTNGRRVKYVRGGGAWIWGTQTVERVPMTSMQIQDTLEGVSTKKGVLANATFNAMIKISDDPQQIILYTEQSSAKKEDEVKKEITDVLTAKVRSVMTSMEYEDINGNFALFSEKVSEAVVEPLKLMGLEVISFDLTKFNDDEGYLKALGAKQISEVKKTAAIAVAQNDKEQAIEEARIASEKEEERQAYVKSQASAELSTELELIENEKQKAEKKAETDLKVKQINIQNEIQIQEEEKRKELALTELDLKVEAERQEREKQISLDLAKKEAEISQVKADRELELARTKSEKEKVDKELQVFKELKDIELEANKVRLDGQARADAIKAVQHSEAEGIASKGKAEAESIRLRAEAESLNAELILAQEALRVLPELAKAVSEPLSRIKEINMYSGGTTDGKGNISGLTTDIIGTASQSMDMLNRMTGIDVSKLLSNSTTRGNTHTVLVPHEEVAVSTESPSKDSNTVVEGVNVLTTPEFENVQEKGWQNGGIIEEVDEVKTSKDNISENDTNVLTSEDTIATESKDKN